MAKELEDFRNYLIEERKSGHTISTYFRSVKKYREWFSSKFDKEMKALHQENINEYIDVMKKERKRSGEMLSAKTINQRLNAIRCYNKFLVETGMAKELVVERKMFQKIQKQATSPSKFTKKEVDRFFQVILENANVVGERDSYRDYTIGKVMSLCGCRIFEALALCHSQDIHLNTREIHIRNGKGNKARTVLINKQLHRILSKYMREIRGEYRLQEVSPYLFLSNRSHYISRNTINKSFKKYSELAGLKEVLSPHDLRHYFCSESIKNGLSLHEVAAIAGHHNIQTTMDYIHSDREEILHKLDNL